MKEIGHGSKTMSTCRGGAHLEDKALSQASSALICFCSSGKKGYIFSQMFHQSVLQVGHTVMHACPRPHKHRDVYKAQVSAKIHNHIYVLEPLLE